MLDTEEKDVLIKINDHDITSLNVVEFWEFLSKLSVPKDGSLTFTFNRGDDIIDVSFSETDMVMKKNESD